MARNPGSSPPSGGGPTLTDTLPPQLPPAVVHWPAITCGHRVGDDAGLDGLAGGVHVHHVEHPAGPAEHHGVRRSVVAVDHLDHHARRLVTQAADHPTAGDVGTRGGATAEGAGRDGEGLHRFLRRVVRRGLVQRVRWLAGRCC